jgi:RNA polymerase sigma-54 factor
VKTGLQLKLAQHLTLTPQLQQSIRLLQLSTLELQQEISAALADNPLLELEDGDDSPELSLESLVEADRDIDSEARLDSDLVIAEVANGAAADAVEFSAESSPSLLNGAEIAVGSKDEATSDVASEMTNAEGADSFDEPERETLDLDDWGSSNASAHDGDDSMEWQRGGNKTLPEHLLEQVPLLREGAAINALLRVMIESLDEDGFLTIDVYGVAELAGVEPNEIAEDWEHALTLLQSLDPIGVGARDLRECLCLQLAEHVQDEPSDASRLALRVVREGFDALSQRDHVRLRKVFGASDVLVREALDIIKMMNPRPGAAFADVAASQMVPDVIVRRTKSRWVVELNQSVVPKLVVNDVYANMLQRQKEGRATPLSNQLQEARWLVKNVAQRFDTILRVANEIVERQQAFFDHGPVAMRPLVLREVADALGLHESTVSRVTTQKYLTSTRGTFEFKYFFGSHVSTEAGGAASSTAIRAMIKTLISEEDTSNPLSDSRIAELLGEQGIIVARRTVAKYREQQGIDPVNLRKQ